MKGFAILVLVFSLVHTYNADSDKWEWKTTQERLQNAKKDVAIQKFRDLYTHHEEKDSDESVRREPLIPPRLSSTKRKQDSLNSDSDSSESSRSTDEISSSNSRFHKTSSRKYQRHRKNDSKEWRTIDRASERNNRKNRVIEKRVRKLQNVRENIEEKFKKFLINLIPKVKERMHIIEMLKQHKMDLCQRLSSLQSYYKKLYEFNKSRYMEWIEKMKIRNYILTHRRNIDMETLLELCKIKRTIPYPFQLALARKCMGIHLSVSDKFEIVTNLPAAIINSTDGTQPWRCMKTSTASPTPPPTTPLDTGRPMLPCGLCSTLDDNHSSTITSDTAESRNTGTTNDSKSTKKNSARHGNKKSGSDESTSSSAATATDETTARDYPNSTLNDIHRWPVINSKTPRRANTGTTRDSETTEQNWSGRTDEATGSTPISESPTSSSARTWTDKAITTGYPKITINDIHRWPVIDSKTLRRLSTGTTSDSETTEQNWSGPTDEATGSTPISESPTSSSAGTWTDKAITTGYPKTTLNDIHRWPVIDSKTPRRLSTGTTSDSETTEQNWSGRTDEATGSTPIRESPTSSSARTWTDKAVTTGYPKTTLNDIHRWPVIDSKTPRRLSTGITSDSETTEQNWSGPTDETRGSTPTSESPTSSSARTWTDKAITTDYPKIAINDIHRWPVIDSKTSRRLSTGTTSDSETTEQNWSGPIDEATGSTPISERPTSSSARTWTDKDITTGYPKTTLNDIHRWPVINSKTPRRANTGTTSDSETTEQNWSGPTDEATGSTPTSESPTSSSARTWTDKAVTTDYPKITINDIHRWPVIDSKTPRRLSTGTTSDSETTEQNWSGPTDEATGNSPISESPTSRIDKASTSETTWTEGSSITETTRRKENTGWTTTYLGTTERGESTPIRQSTTQRTAGYTGTTEIPTGWNDARTTEETVPVEDETKTAVISNSKSVPVLIITTEQPDAEESTNNSEQTTQSLSGTTIEATNSTSTSRSGTTSNDSESTTEEAATTESLTETAIISNSKSVPVIIIRTEQPNAEESTNNSEQTTQSLSGTTIEATNSTSTSRSGTTSNNSESTTEEAATTEGLTETAIISNSKSVPVVIITTEQSDAEESTNNSEQTTQSSSGTTVEDTNSTSTSRSGTTSNDSESTTEEAATTEGLTEIAIISNSISSIESQQETTTDNNNEPSSTTANQTAKSTNTSGSTAQTLSVFNVDGINIMNTSSKVTAWTENAINSSVTTDQPDSSSTNSESPEAVTSDAAEGTDVEKSIGNPESTSAGGDLNDGTTDSSGTSSSDVTTQNEADW